MHIHQSPGDHRSLLERRAFLGRAATALPVLYAAGQPITAKAEDEDPAAKDGKPMADPAYPGVISRQRQPLNAEFPFPTLNSFLTPNEQFYIRTHFEVPRLKATDWKLKVEGHVERPIEISYDELRKAGSQELTALLECSGNSRVLLEPPQVSIRWEQGGVSNARWTGVPLSAVLKRAGVKPGAVEVILEGHDAGEFKPPQSSTPGKIHYARSLPLEQARRPEVLLAWQMNGSDLPPEHGYPVRAVVAGWYGMASVKWLRRVIVTDRPFHGYFQTFAYSIWERQPDGLPTLVPVTEMKVKSQIARPMLHEAVERKARYRVHGAAWAGEAEVSQVEISTNDGKSWEAARLDQRSEPYTWRFFEYEWQVPSQPGRYTLMSRATDSRGNVQPLERDRDRRNAVVNHVQPMEILVR